VSHAARSAHRRRSRASPHSFNFENSNININDVVPGLKFAANLLGAVSTSGGVYVKREPPLKQCESSLPDCVAVLLTCAPTDVCDAGAATKCG
jgi:hypothetical protein